MGNWPTGFEVPKLKAHLQQLEQAQRQPDFWKDQVAAQATSQEVAVLRGEVGFIEATGEQLRDLAELLKLAVSEADQQTLVDVAAGLISFEQQLSSKEREQRFSGLHDRNDAIITIQSGAGGTDAQDWAQMLERMYLRFAEAKNWPTRILDRSAGEEAGIKHVTFETRGKFAYGLLKSEHGVHRLVRLSPFNSDHLRQTSFARVEIIPKLTAKETLVIDPKDLEIDTFRASGAGGQHVNKTSSAVRIRHIPSGVVVTCQNERSQAQNKDQAMSILQAKLVTLAEQQHAREIKEIKGETKEAAWGNQIRSYVLHPYTLVKDHRTKKEVSDVQRVLNGDLTEFIDMI